MPLQCLFFTGNRKKLTFNIKNQSFKVPLTVDWFRSSFSV